MIAQGTRAFFGFTPSAARLKRGPAVIASLPAERILVESDLHEAERAPAAVLEVPFLILECKIEVRVRLTFFSSDVITGETSRWRHLVFYMLSGACCLVHAVCCILSGACWLVHAV